jgi:hypothetical protein
MSPSRLVAASLAVAALSLSLCRPAAEARPSAPDRPQVVLPRGLFVRFKPIVRRWARENSEARKFVKDHSKDLLDIAVDAWQNSQGSQCRQPLPGRFCRPEPPRLFTGIAMSFGGRVPGVWTAPVSPRSSLGSLRAGNLYYLACYAYGERPSDGTSLWHRLSGGGGYVNDAWLDTGTVYPIAGEPRCRG